MRGLYAIVDVDALAKRGLAPERFAEAVLAARPAAIQLRDKRRGAAETLATLRAIAPLARRAGVPLFANDRPDLAKLAGCDGVHVGQEDLEPELVRRFDPGLAVGLSTHDDEQLERASQIEELAYVAIGPIFATSSKERPSPVVGLEGLAALAARSRRARPGRDIVAIGGIDIEHAKAVATLADAIAVISALVPPLEVGDPYAEAESRARAFGQAVAQADRGAT